MIQFIWVAIIMIVVIVFSQFVDFEEANVTPLKKVETTSPIITKELSIVDGKDSETGFIIDEGWDVVKTNCTSCHNSKIILQNKFTKEGWKELIVWMQETQGLWKLGDNEEIILNYLSKNYAPVKKGRRVPLELKEDDWYVLEE